MSTRSVRVPHPAGHEVRALAHPSRPGAAVHRRGQAALRCEVGHGDRVVDVVDVSHRRQPRAAQTECRQPRELGLAGLLRAHRDTVEHARDRPAGADQPVAPVERGAEHCVDPGCQQGARAPLQQGAVQLGGVHPDEEDRQPAAGPCIREGPRQPVAEGAGPLCEHVEAGGQPLAGAPCQHDEPGGRGCGGDRIARVGERRRERRRRPVRT